MAQRRAVDYTSYMKAISYADLKEMEQRGYSKVGFLYRGRLKGEFVCVKTYGFGNETTSELTKLENQLLDEAQILYDLDHSKVIKLLGVVSDAPDKQLKVVTEWMPSCSFRHAIAEGRCPNTRQRLKIALDAAKGLEHMHHRNKKFINFKHTNLILDLEDSIVLTCKVGDICLFNEERKPGDDGSLPWTAPELLTDMNCNVDHKKADIYAFGIVMWEIVTGQIPYNGMSDYDIIAHVVNNEGRPSISELDDPIWRALIAKCWAQDPQDRPGSLGVIVKGLANMYTQ